MRALLYFGAVALAGCQKAEPAPQPTPVPEIGRFIIVQSREQSGDYLVDTATGKAWASYRLADHGNRLVGIYTTRLDDSKQVRKFITSLKPSRPRVRVK